jgi:hypothetical protein
VIHAGVGKVSFDDGKLAQNIRAFVDAVSKAKPVGRQGHLPEEGVAVLDHGSGRVGRHLVGDPGVTKSRPAREGDYPGRRNLLGPVLSETVGGAQTP